MLDNEPMTESELRLLRSQLFRAADDEYKDLSHLDHDLEGNIQRASITDRESDSISSTNRTRTDSAISMGRSRAGSSASQRLSALTDMSMRELAATLKGDRGLSRIRSSMNSPELDNSEGQGRLRVMSTDRSASGGKIRNLHGIKNTKHALLSPTSFDGEDRRGVDNGRKKREASGTMEFPGGNSARGSPSRKAKTKFENISTTSGDDIYVRKAKAGRRVPKIEPVVAEIFGGQSFISSDMDDMKRMLQETTMRIEQMNGKATGEQELLIQSDDDGEEGTYNFSPIKSAPVNIAIDSPAVKGPISEASSLANTPQIYSLHETSQERESIMHNSDEIDLGETEMRQSSDKRVSIASGEDEAEFNIGSLGAPKYVVQDTDQKDTSAIESAPTGKKKERSSDAQTELEPERSRLISRDMPLDQRMRLLSVMSSEEGSSRHGSVDSMNTSSHIAQLRSSLHDATVFRGTENVAELPSGFGLPSTAEVPSVFLASMAERAEREKERKEKEKTPISSMLGTLGIASTPVGSAENTPAGTPSRSKERFSTPPHGSSDRDSEDSSASRSTKALATAASLLRNGPQGRCRVRIFAKQTTAPYRGQYFN